MLLAISYSNAMKTVKWQIMKEWIYWNLKNTNCLWSKTCQPQDHSSSLSVLGGVLILIKEKHKKRSIFFLHKII